MISLTLTNLLAATTGFLIDFPTLLTLSGIIVGVTVYLNTKLTEIEKSILHKVDLVDDELHTLQSSIEKDLIKGNFYLDQLNNRVSSLKTNTIKNTNNLATRLNDIELFLQENSTFIIRRSCKIDKSSFITRTDNDDSEGNLNTDTDNWNTGFFDHD